MDDIFEFTTFSNLQYRATEHADISIYANLNSSKKTVMLFSPSIIIRILGALWSLQSDIAASAPKVTSRSTHITCGGQFPKAGDGFAKRPKGCSSRRDNPTQVRDK